MPSKNKEAVIVFAKYPVEGRVKTRLAVSLGNRDALSLYRSITSYIFAELEKIESDGTDVYLFYSNHKDSEEVKKWVGKDFRFVEQNGSVLGEKMSAAFKYVFDEGYDRVIIIGTDVPDLSSSRLNDAFEKLDNTDIILGPCPDGGYYLLGMKKFLPHLFENIEWSSENVLNSTIEKIDDLGLEYIQLDPLIDIDNENDLKVWLEINNSGNTGLKEVIRNSMGKRDDKIIPPGKN